MEIIRVIATHMGKLGQQGQETHETDMLRFPSQYEHLLFQQVRVSVHKMRQRAEIFRIEKHDSELWLKVQC
jgi:hypothetical protein